MKFKPLLVLICLTFFNVYTIQRNENLIKHQFSKINIYCRQKFVDKGTGARSHIQCASNCLSHFTPYCKGFIWNETGKTCLTTGEILISNSASEMDVYNVYKDGCTNKGYYYDLHSNTCLKMYVDNGKTWKNARNHCQENGGDLISLTTPAKWEFVTNFTSCRTNMWIGLKDEIWVTNATFDKNVFNVTTQFNYFDSGYRNDSEQGCGKFSYKSTNVLQDESCNLRRKEIYVCEILM
ncbi:MRC [Mytilus coruscus]|uniref:MRC n=1 Tax=Mytilus coruscus TaxID=42192 RepID=A0A6J8B3K4_MYTCO|nr:MRC [Mytilus coruscus]